MADDRVVLREGAVEARVTLDGEEGALPLFVARGASATLETDGVLLREGADAAVVRWRGVVREVPLWKERPDGSLARVRVKRISERHR